MGNRIALELVRNTLSVYGRVTGNSGIKRLKFKTNGLLTRSVPKEILSTCYSRKGSAALINEDLTTRSKPCFGRIREQFDTHFLLTLESIPGFRLFR